MLCRLGVEISYNFEYSWLMKTCTRCGISKDLSEFNFKIKAKNLYSYHCRDCSKKYIRNHYLNNRTYYLKKAKKRNAIVRKEIRDYLWEYLKAHGCVDCGENNPIVLEFDHIKDKLLAVSSFARGHKLKDVQNEVAKCEVRCANCHRIKTAIQFGWHKERLPL